MPEWEPCPGSDTPTEDNGLLPCPQCTVYTLASGGRFIDHDRKVES